VDRDILTPSNGKIHITLGFVLNVLITLTAIIISFVTLRNDTFNALKDIAKQEVIIQKHQESILNMQMAIQRLADDEKYFHEQYNEDMNRYIREKPK
jgi:hypothetical protein